MKNKRVIFSGIFGFLILFIGIFYFTSYSSFNEHTLAYAEIHAIQYKQESLETVYYNSQGKYRFSEEDQISLLENIEQTRKNKLDKDDITEIDNLDQEKLFSFTLRLINKFNQERDYKFYLENHNSVFMESEDSLYEITDSDFYYSHEAFDPYYLEKYLPKIELESVTVFGAVGNEDYWKVQRYDGSWMKSLIYESESDPMAIEKTSIVLKEEHPLKVSFNEMPDSVTHSIFNNKTKEEIEIMEPEELRHDSLPVLDVNGDYNYQLEIFWEEGVQTQAVLSFDIEVSLPIKFVIEDTKVVQDDIIKIIAERAASAEEIEAYWEISEGLNWHKEGEQLKAVIATNYHTDPGNYTLELKDLAHEKVHTYNIEILARDYKTQYLSIDPSIEQRTRNEEAYEEMNTYFSHTWDSSSESKYYEEEFLLPTEGRLTTEFGEQRFVNQELTSYRHNGIDIAAPIGTEILSTNYGEVVFEREMILMGKTVVIDHGHGILSTYMHMDEIWVSEGDWVEKGEAIGTVGTTGFSTGPHLHFTMTYYNVPLEPGYFIIGEPYTKESHYQIRR